MGRKMKKKPFETSASVCLASLWEARKASEFPSAPYAGQDSPEERGQMAFKMNLTSKRY